MFRQAVFVVVQFADDARDVYEKKLPTKSQRKAIVELHDLDGKHNAHYFSTFSSISRPKMELKTCQFRTILDSALRSTSYQRVFKIHFRCRDLKKVIGSSSGRTIPTFTTSPPFSFDFSDENGNKDVPIRDYFGFSHALHLLPAVFRNSFSLRRLKKYNKQYSYKVRDVL